MSTEGPKGSAAPGAEPAVGSVRKRRPYLRDAAIIFAVTLLLLELALRAMGLRQPILYEADPTAGYRIRPNQDVRLLGNEIAINSWGVRDARRLDAKPAGNIRRVLVLGDSVTWGGVRLHQDELFTAIAEHALPGTQVINCGVNGYSVTQMAVLYRNHLAALEAGRIAVFAIPRDFTRPPVVRLTGSGYSFPQYRPRFAVPAALSLIQVLAYQRFHAQWLEPAPAAVPVHPGLTEAECIEANMVALQQLAKDLAGRAELDVFMLPTLPGTPSADRMDALMAELARRGLKATNLADRAKFDATLYLDGVHLNAEGHAVAGRILGEALAPS